MRKAAKPWSRSSATGCAPARISPKASPPSVKNASRSTGRQCALIHTSASRRKPGPTRQRAEKRISGSRLSPGRHFFDCLRGVIGEDDRRDERPGLDKGSLGGLAAELFHRAQEAEPVQHLMLPGLLDLVGRVAIQTGLLPNPNGAVEPATAFTTGQECQVLPGENEWHQVDQATKPGPHG